MVIDCATENSIYSKIAELYKKVQYYAKIPWWNTSGTEPRNGWSVVKILMTTIHMDIVDGPHFFYYCPL